MKLRPTLVLLILSAGFPAGCGNQSDESTTTEATSPPISTPEASMTALTPIDDAPTLTEDSLRAFEQKYACQLPDDYRTFMLENNGGFPTPDCVTFTEDGRETASDVFCFFAIGEERAGLSLDWHHETLSDRLPEQTLPIARDSCGNLWLLRVGGQQTGSVYFWDHGTYDTFDETNSDNWPRVAESFREFRNRLSLYDRSVEKNEVLSRYALVKQAAEAMARQHAGFRTRENPGFVWHCACDDEGNVSLEFVKYEIHAAVPHTDGYSRLRAIKGLIEEGGTAITGISRGPRGR